MSDTETARAAYPAATVTGYPRIGPNRELKRALEALWPGKISAGEFETACLLYTSDAADDSPPV